MNLLSLFKFWNISYFIYQTEKLSLTASIIAIETTASNPHRIKSHDR